MTEAAATFDTVTDYLSSDHDRLDALLEAVRRFVEKGDWEQAQSMYAEFDRGLDRHIRMEEEILFPLFQARTGIAGPTTVMREEHHLIRGVLALLSSAVLRKRADDFHAGRFALVSVLGPHNEKEERVLYPMTDRVLPGRERENLAARLERE